MVSSTGYENIYETNQNRFELSEGKTDLCEFDLGNGQKKSYQRVEDPEKIAQIETSGTKCSWGVPFGQVSSGSYYIQRQINPKRVPSGYIKIISKEKSRLNWKYGGSEITGAKEDWMYFCERRRERAVDEI